MKKRAIYKDGDDLCLSSDKEDGLIQPFNQVATIKYVANYSPANRALIEFGLCTGFSAAKALLANDEFAGFIKTLDNFKLTSKASSILAFVLKQQTNLELPHLFNNDYVQLRLRNGTTIESHSTKSMASILYSIAADSKKAFAIGGSVHEFSTAITAMPDKKIYQLSMGAHAMLMQKCNGKLILYDSNLGTIVSNGLSTGLVSHLKNYDSTLSFAMFGDKKTQTFSIKMPSNSKAEQLFFDTSILLGDLSFPKQIFKIKPELQLIQSSNRGGLLPLNQAASHGRVAAIHWLIAQGASVHNSGPARTPAVLSAAEHGHTPVLKALLEKGASPDQTSEIEATALQRAAQNGHSEFVEVLLEHNASIDLANSDGSTPLLLSAKNGHAEIVRTLLKHHANPSLATKAGFTPLILAVAAQHVEVVEILLQHLANPNQLMPNGMSPLTIASQTGNMRIIELLLSYGAEPIIDISFADVIKPEIYRHIEQAKFKASRSNETPLSLTP